MSTCYIVWYCSAAELFSLLSFSLSCVTLYWCEFALLAYQITYRRNSSNSNAATVDVLSPSARQYTATGLKPELVYVFRLTAQTRKGWGEAAEALVVTTEKRGKNTAAEIYLWFTSKCLESERICVYVCVPFSPTSTHKPPCSAPRGSSGSKSAVVMGTRQRRPVTSSLLHSPVQRASRQQLDGPLCVSQPRVALLHCGQVNVKVQLRQQFFINHTVWK